MFRGEVAPQMAKDEVKIGGTGVSRVAKHGVRVLVARISSWFGRDYEVSFRMARDGPQRNAVSDV